MRSRVSSRTALRRSRLLPLLFLVGAVAVQALELRVVSVRAVPGGCRVDCALSGFDRERLLRALDDGDTVEVLLRIRGSAPARFLPEERDSSGTLRRRARWDAIEKLYLIEEGGERRFFPHKDAFLAALLTFDGVETDAPRGNSGYALQGEIAWRLLNPPLNILTPFLPGLRSQTGWYSIPTCSREDADDQGA